MNIRKNIPNTITAGNLMCGCIAVVFAFRGDLVMAAYLVGLAAILDFFDGFAARLLKVSSPIGKDLDSLADMVTFGLVPGICIFHLMYFSLIQTKAGNIPIDLSKQFSDEGVAFFFSKWELILPFLAFFIPVFSAVRLAKFNNDSRQQDSFLGLPTPANAILIMSIPLFLSRKFDFDTFDFAINPLFYSKGQFNSLLLSKSVGMCLNDTHFGAISRIILTLFSSVWFYVFFIIISCFLLVSEIPLIALKFKNYQWKGNEYRWILVLGSVGLLVFSGLEGVGLVILFYLILSIIPNFIKK